VLPVLNLVCYVSFCEGLRAGAGSLSYIVHVDCCGLSTIVIKKIIIIIIIQQFNTAHCWIVRMLLWCRHNTLLSLLPKQTQFTQHFLIQFQTCTFQVTAIHSASSGTTQNAAHRKNTLCQPPRTPVILVRKSCKQSTSVSRMRCMHLLHGAISEDNLGSHCCVRSD